MELKNLGENLGFSYLFAGDFEKNETATLLSVAAAAAEDKLAKPTMPAEKGIERG